MTPLAACSEISNRPRQPGIELGVLGRSSSKGETTLFLVIASTTECDEKEVDTYGWALMVSLPDRLNVRVVCFTFRSRGL